MIKTHKSLFNLIEIFRNGKKEAFNRLLPKTHCEHKSLHDYYCDAEKPFVPSKE
ncbi:hypothetical protein [Aureisphaera sp.]